MTINIEILTKKDCCLCDDAKAIIECVLNDYPATLKLIDIESDPVLFASYKERIPVVRQWRGKFCLQDARNHPAEKTGQTRIIT
jgi:hypothetical protein